MPDITFLPDKKTVSVAAGVSIADAARIAGVAIETPCGGAQICGKCKVRLAPADLARVTVGGAHMTDEAERAEGCVLACSSTVNGDICVTIPRLDADAPASAQIVTGGVSFDMEMHPKICKVYMQEQNKTVVSVTGGARLGAETGDTGGELYGVVVDIGTTTLVAELVDMSSGTTAAGASSVNPQTAYGQDVLSRIQFASEPQGLDTLRTAVLREINAMLSRLCDDAGISAERVYELVLSGNTAMLHLAMGLDPSSLGRVPFTSLLSGNESYNARTGGFDISSFGLAYLPPLISAYVGADICSGILAAQLHRLKGRSLFIDIGTNGEMVVADNGKLYAASTAAGPAFEGMNIRHGSRAVSGAIEYFRIGAAGDCTVRAIGGAAPSCICGSGLIDIVGELVANGVIDGSGRFESAKRLPPGLAAHMTLADGKPAFSLAPDVVLTQQDIRQVQLAKGALRAGVETLLSIVETDAGDLDRVLIAGSFGYHLREESLINIGLLPAAFAGKIKFLGNTSQSGGRAFLLNTYYRDEIAALVSEAETVELANRGDFNDLFIDCLNF
jgi:uncharacterized 2Fe-2S/4Fe-4S cluster protein (DUF4445 family)